MQAIFNPHSFKQIKCYLKEVPIVEKPIVEQIVEPEETKSSLYNDN